MVRQQTKVMYQQRVSRSGSRITKRTVGESRQSPPLAFMLEGNILSRCSNNKKFELMFTRRAKACSSSGSVG